MSQKERQARYREKNRAILAAKQAVRRAGPAAPSWLTPEQHAQMVTVYVEAEAWAAQTGIKHSVDHLVPLIGTNRDSEHYVCGLHVPWNLRAIPEHLNGRRSNWFPDGMPTEGRILDWPESEDPDDIPFQRRVAKSLQKRKKANPKVHPFCFTIK